MTFVETAAFVIGYWAVIEVILTNVSFEKIVLTLTIMFSWIFSKNSTELCLKFTTKNEISYEINEGEFQDSI